MNLIGRLINSLRPTWVVIEPTYIPPAAGPVNRWLHARPRDLNLRAPQGVWCPMCDHAVSKAVDGWRCMTPSCWAAWDHAGRATGWIGGETR